MSRQAYVQPPAGAEPLAVEGPGPFVTHAHFRLADGRVLEWASRRHRKGGGDRLGRWIAVLFIIGSACFAVGSLPGYSSLVSQRTDAITYFVGSLFFTSAAYLQYVECISAAPSLDEDATPQRRLLGLEPGRIDWWATSVQLAGTLSSTSPPSPPSTRASRRGAQTWSCGRRMRSARSAS